MVAQTLWVGYLHEVKPKLQKQCTSGIPSFISFQLSWHSSQKLMFR